MKLLPDMDNRTEMWMVVNIAGGLARANEWVFLGVLCLLIAYGLARILIEVCRYLFAMYRERAFTPSPHMQNFRNLLMGGAVVLVLSAIFGGFFIAFAAFSIASVAYDWYVSRNEQPDTSELEGVTLDDVVAWQRQINTAHDAGLLMGSEP